MKKLWAGIALAVFLAAFVAQAEVKRSTLEKRIIRSEESFQNVVDSKTGPIPPELVARAQGILIYRQYGAGFWVGGKGGFGVAMARQRDGRWGAPAFVKSVDGSFGLQIGVQQIDLVFLFMNRDAMDVFRGGKFRIGVDASAAAGPVGGNVEGKVGAPILVYSSNGGLYIGAAFEGGVMIPDNEANASFYEVDEIAVPDILYRGGMPYPGVAEGLRRVIENYEAPARPQRKNGQPRRNATGGYNGYNNGGVY